MVLVCGSNAVMGVKLMFQVISRAECGHQGSGIALLDLTGDWCLGCLSFVSPAAELLPRRQSSAQASGWSPQIFRHDLSSQSVFSQNLCLPCVCLSGRLIILSPAVFSFF